jgi:hypothetical protein
VDFGKLGGFTFRIPESPVRPDSNTPLPNLLLQVPQAVRDLDGTNVAVRGFMLPVNVENGLARRFVLLRDRSACCLGARPLFNHFIYVDLTGPGGNRRRAAACG